MLPASYRGSGVSQCGARGIYGGQSNTEGLGSFQAFRVSSDIYYSTNALYRSVVRGWYNYAHQGMQCQVTHPTPQNKGRESQ